MSNNTPYFTKERVERQWYVVDCTDQVLGRVAASIAKILLGKTQPQYTPGQDTGGFVVAINTDKLRVTGNKLNAKMYYNHSGYPGGLRTRTLKERMDKDSAEVLRDAVKGMLPHNKIGARLITKLKMYKGDKHPHDAQAPETVSAEQLAAQ
jgi:large subunit ribosomal protein L13